MASRVPRVAAADSPSPFKQASNQSVLLDRLNHVRTARWREATIGAYQRTDANLVCTHQANHTLARKPDKEANEVHDLLRRRSYLAMRCVSVKSDCSILLKSN